MNASLSKDETARRKETFLEWPRVFVPVEALMPISGGRDTIRGTPVTHSSIF